MVLRNGETFLLDFTASPLENPECDRIIMVVIFAANAKQFSNFILFIYFENGKDFVTLFKEKMLQSCESNLYGW